MKAGIESVKENYDSLIAAVFKQAYDDLVSSLRLVKRERDKRAGNPVSLIRDDRSRRERYAEWRISYIEVWVRKTMPIWLDISPEKFIEWAHKEAGDEGFQRHYTGTQFRKIYRKGSGLDQGPNLRAGLVRNNRCL